MWLRIVGFTFTVCISRQTFKIPSIGSQTFLSSIDHLEFLKSEKNLNQRKAFNRTANSQISKIAGSSGFNLLDAQKSFESQTFQIVLLIKRVLYCCRCVGKQKPEIQFETFKQKPVLKQFKTIQPEIQSFSK